MLRTMAHLGFRMVRTTEPRILWNVAYKLGY